jgi:hypothetical protein
MDFISSLPNLFGTKSVVLGPTGVPCRVRPSVWWTRALSFSVANESKPQARKYGREYKLAQEHTTLERFGPRKCNTIHPLCCIVLSFSELQLVKRVSQCLRVRLLSLLDLSKGGDLYPFLDQGQWVTHMVYKMSRQSRSVSIVSCNSMTRCYNICTIQSSWLSIASAWLSPSSAIHTLFILSHCAHVRCFDLVESGTNVVGACLVLCHHGVMLAPYR